MNNLEKENFLILGAGNMGICFVKALIQNRIKANRIKIIEKNNLRKVDKIVLSTTKLLSNFSIKNLKITSVIILKKTI